MRLLSPSDAAKSKRDFEQSEIQRIAELHHLLEEEEKSVAALREQKETERMKIEGDFTAFISDYQAKVATAKKEVTKLENRRERALKPIDELEKDLAIRQESVVKKEIEADAKLKESERLENDAALRSYLLDSKVKEATIRENIAESNQKESEVSLKKAEDYLRGAEQERNVAGKEYTRQTNLILQERSEIEQKEVELSKREQMLIEGNKALKNDRIHLQSQQETLRSAFEEARRKNLL